MAEDVKEQLERVLASEDPGEAIDGAATDPRLLRALNQRILSRTSS